MSSLPDPLRVVEAVDPAEFASIYLEHSGRIVRYLLGLLHDPAEAEDVMHEVFLKAYRAMTGETPPEMVAGWLFAVAKTTAIDHLRRRARSRPVPPTVIVDMADRRRISEREPNRHWISEPEVREMLAELPARQQEIIVLRYLMGCTHADIARILECTELSVRKAHQRALQALAHALATSELAAGRTRRGYPMRAVRIPRRIALSGFTLLRRRRLAA
jgi:RNA polymerase sigma-70 factor (ECF subfamily)